MKQNLNEIRRMQQLAGLITESKLLENELSQAEATADKVADRLEDKVAQLSPEQIDQLKAELSQLGITADTPIEQAAEEIKDEIGTDQLGEAVSSSRKIGSILGSIGTGLIGSLLVPIIPVAVGLGVGSVAGGFAITFATAALLKGLAKALGDEKPVSENDELFEIRQLVREVIKDSMLNEEEGLVGYPGGDTTGPYIRFNVNSVYSNDPESFQIQILPSMEDAVLKLMPNWKYDGMVKINSRWHRINPEKLEARIDALK